MSFLHLESVRSSSSSGLLELASLRDKTRLDSIVSVWVSHGGSVSKVLDSLTRKLGATEKHSVGALGSAKSELVESDGLASSLDDAGAGRLSESHGSNGHGRKIQKTSIISDGSYNYGSDVLLTIESLGDTRDRHGGVVDSRHSESSCDGESELGISSAGQETVWRRRHKEGGGGEKQTEKWVLI